MLSYNNDKNNIWDYSFIAVLASSSAFDHTIISRICLLIFFSLSIYYICKKKLFSFSLIFVVYALFICLGYYNLYNGNSIDPLGTNKILKTMLLNLFFIFCLTQFFNIKNIETVKKIIITSSLVSATFVFIVAILRTGSIFLREDMEIIGINSNTTAIFCAYAITLIVTNRNLKTKHIIIVLYLLLFCALSGTRKAFLVIIVGYFTYKLLKNISQLVVNVFISFLLLVVLYICIMRIPFLYENIGYRFESLIVMLRGGEGDGSEEARVRMIEYGMTYFAENPMNGYGLDTFRSIYGKYSHNNYVEILFSLGIPGIIVYYSMLVILLVATIKKRIIYKLPQYGLAIGLIISYLIIDYAIVSYYSRSCFVILLMLYSLARKPLKS